MSEITYKLKNIYNMDGTVATQHVLCSDGRGIPDNPDNTDYQEYLKWVADGNTPQPADY
jgi:hypothetical protein